MKHQEISSRFRSIACKTAGTGHLVGVFAIAVLGIANSPGYAQSKTKTKTAIKADPAGPLLSGKKAMDDWTTDAPGVRRKMMASDMPPPYTTPSVDHGANVIPQPEGAWPKVPPGFTVDKYFTGLDNGREIITAPNGDLFIAESGPGIIRVLRGKGADGKPLADSNFLTGLNKPFGMCFYPAGPNPKFLYIGNTDRVVRVPYHNGDMQATAAETAIVPDLPGGGRLRGGGHWTRDVKFSKDGSKMYVSVGSITNDFENPNAPEERRADILEFNPDGSGEKIYASGIRNAVGLAIHPQTGELWASVNERDGLGDDLVPDYVTRVKPGGFYGWPWFYIGSNVDPRHKGEHEEMLSKVLVPDVLVQSHLASLCLTFYTGTQFPSEYEYDGFAAEHGSWNRDRRVGYKLIRIPLKNGIPNREYDDFMTGFVTPTGDVWGRPVGVTVGMDGSLFVTDDASGTVWNIRYTGSKVAKK